MDLRLSAKCGGEMGVETKGEELVLLCWPTKCEGELVEELTLLYPAR